MKNDKLILQLVKEGRLTADLDTGQVFLDGKEKGWKHSTGYIRFEYYHKGKRRCFIMQRVVYIIGTNKLPRHDWEVDHIDTIKTNNKFKNLELVPGAVNVRRAHENGLCSSENNHMVRDPNSGKFVSDLPVAPF